MILLLHWWNNINICQKNKFYLPPDCPLAPQFVKYLIPIERKIVIFSMGPVLVIFLFFWTDNAPCPPLASPPGPHIFKILNTHRRKQIDENYVEFYFSMDAVLVIFSFRWTYNAPGLPPSPPPHTICKTFNFNRRKKKCNENYVKFYFSMSTVLVIFSFFWKDNDLVCAPPPGVVSPHHNMCTYFGAYLKNYSHDFPETLGSCSKQYKGN